MIPTCRVRCGGACWSPREEVLRLNLDPLYTLCCRGETRGQVGLVRTGYLAGRGVVTEAVDLCRCIDLVSRTYRRHLIDTENHLHSWRYPAVLTPFGRGFVLLTVASWCWDLIEQFAHTFDWVKGSTSWHVFDLGKTYLSIRHGERVHMDLWADRASNGDVRLVYGPPTEDFTLDLVPPKRIAMQVGPAGLWSVRHADHWCRAELIPAVLNYHGFTGAGSLLPSSAPIQTPPILSYPSLRKLHTATAFASYLGDVQHWLDDYSPFRLSSRMMRAYYTAFIALLQQVQPESLEPHWLDETLHSLRLSLAQERSPQVMAADGTTAEAYATLLHSLEQHQQQLRHRPCERSSTAAVLTQLFRDVITHATMAPSQETLHMARLILQRLWRRSRFECRYIPHPESQH